MGLLFYLGEYSDQVILNIIRHAQASSNSLDGADKGRILTDEGLLQAVKLGKYFLSSEDRPELILCSPYRRTLETAHLIAEYGNLDNPQEESWLAAGMHPETALAELQVYKEFRSIILIGHQPDLSYLIERLDVVRKLVDVEVASLHQFTGEPKEAGGIFKKIQYSE